MRRYIGTSSTVIAGQRPFDSFEHCSVGTFKRRSYRRRIRAWTSPTMSPTTKPATAARAL